MRQETAFFEKQQIEALPSKISEQFLLIGEGAGERSGQMIASVSSVIAGLLAAFIFAPWLALVVSIYIPLTACLLGYLGKKVFASTHKKMAQSGLLG